MGCHFLLQCMKVKSEREVAQSCLLATPWTAAYQAPPSMGFSRQEYWSGVPLPSLRSGATYSFLFQVYAVSITTYSTESIAKCGCSVAKSHLTFFVTPWTVTRLLLSVGLPRQEYWSGLPFPSPGDLPDPGITPMSPAWASGIFTTGTSGKPP